MGVILTGSTYNFSILAFRWKKASNRQKSPYFCFNKAYGYRPKNPVALEIAEGLLGIVVNSSSKNRSEKNSSYKAVVRLFEPTA